MKTSLEAEYWVVDADGNLASADGLVESPRERERERRRSAASAAAGAGAPRVTVTTPLESPSDLAATFTAELEAVRSRAADRERRLVPLGTTINAADDAVGEPSERERIRRAVAGRDICGNRCAGTRVRIDLDPGRETGRAVDRLNALVALEPALALVNSAPYVRGERVASGARTYCQRTAFYDAWSPDDPERDRDPDPDPDRIRIRFGTGIGIGIGGDGGDAPGDTSTPSRSGGNGSRTGATPSRPRRRRTASTSRPSRRSPRPTSSRRRSVCTTMRGCSRPRSSSGARPTPRCRASSSGWFATSRRW
ncbi:glutamate-cysteine ligase family protein [Natronobacterium lacisalsi]|uniref:glutamate-cysteine ligase family protein n=1 Tax=Natronobacterium lacisalsi TaxID=229731 RepID=UPI00067828F9|nr:glutamate-cysteine ligase family protein [Halobiforma lacisalsi]